MTTKIITEDLDPISEEYFTANLAKCLAKAALDYSLESVFFVTVASDSDNIKMKVTVSPDDNQLGL